MKHAIRWMTLTALAAQTVLTCLANEGEFVDAGAPFGRLKLVQEIDCAQPNKDLLFLEFPKGVSQVETILGQECRVLPNDSGDAKFFAYRLGEGQGLEAGKAYVLTIEFPDDRPRSLFVCNWGCETARGVHTGSTVGDTAKGLYTNHNPESLKIPQSGKMMNFQQLFWMHDRTPEIKRPRGRTVRPLVPENGFWVIIAQPHSALWPMSAGAAVSKIRLFEAGDEARLENKINYPPEGLPKRHVFWREEMADGVISMGHTPEEKDPTLRGVTNPVDWYDYKLRLMDFLGINTFSRDLLEFGHNQGWDSSKYGGSNWYNQSAVPEGWENILNMISDKHPGTYVLPYYEYAGSIGQDKALAIGSQRRCERLDGGKDYTHIAWVHKTNADLADPDFIQDAEKVLELTITQFKDKANFIGAWFRPRPEANPISFNEKDLKRFSAEANDGQRITRSHLQTDKELLQKYYRWWFEKRHEFLLTLNQYLKDNVNPDSIFLYTCDASEPGISINGKLAAGGQAKPWEWKSLMVTDDVTGWTDKLNSDDRFKFTKPVSYQTVMQNDYFAKSLLMDRGNWGNWEWPHACPRNDPETYQNTEGVMLTYSMHRLFSVSSPSAFESFRTPTGLAVLRHYALNENEMTVGKDDILGYFVADVERAGPFSMMVEARAMAYGDPRYLGYLAGNNFTKCFPEYSRAFYAAFLSLPALPSTMLSGASSDKEVIVREIKTDQNGTYYAIVNTGFVDKTVTVTLPASGDITDAPTGQNVAAEDGRVTFLLYPGQLRALVVK